MLAPAAGDSALRVGNVGEAARATMKGEDCDRRAHMGDTMDYINEAPADASTKPTAQNKSTEKSRAIRAKGSKPKSKGTVGKEPARDEEIPKRNGRRRPPETGRHRQVGLADYLK